MPLASRIEQGFVRRLEPLPAETRRVLLLAAAEPVGDATLLRRAAALLGIGAGRGGTGRGGRPGRDRRAGAVPPSAGALGRLPGRVRARAAGRPSSAGRCDRRAARPRPSSVAPRPRGRGSRRGRWPASWSARPSRAQARGGLAAAAAFLERAAAADAGPGPAWAARAGRRRGDAASRRVRRGARSAHHCRARRRSTRCRARGSTCCAPRSRSLRATAARLRRCCSPLRAQLEPLDDALARETYLEAYSRRDDAPVGPSRPPVARGGARRAPVAVAAEPGAHRATSCSTAWPRSSRTATPPRCRSGGERCALSVSDDLTEEEGLRWLWLASSEAVRAVGRRELVRPRRRVTSTWPAPPARSACSRSTLHSRAVAHMFAGELDAAASLVAELDAVAARDRHDPGAVRCIVAGRLARPSSRKSAPSSKPHWTRSSRVVRDLGARHAVGEGGAGEWLGAT